MTSEGDGTRVECTAWLKWTVAMSCSGKSLVGYVLQFISNGIELSAFVDVMWNIVLVLGRTSR